MAYDIENLDDFDLAATGAGSGRGTQRLSRQDLQELHSTGKFSKQELLDYSDRVTRSFDDDDKGWGSKAQSLLDDWRSETPEDTTSAPKEEGETTQMKAFSPHIQEAIQRSNSYRERAWSGQTSQDIFGKSNALADGVNAAGVSSIQKAQQAADSEVARITARY